MAIQNKYYLGLDIGTDSVGYAVTNEQYDLLKHRGEPMWGVHLFDEAALNTDRRGFRTSRRRIDRRQQRVKMVQDIFVAEIAHVDENFYRRIQESALSSRCKLDLKMGYMVIRGEDTKHIFLDEIALLMIENPAVSLTDCRTNLVLSQNEKFSIYQNIPKSLPTLSILI